MAKKEQVPNRQYGLMSIRQLVFTIAAVALSFICAADSGEENQGQVLHEHILVEIDHTTTSSDA